MTCACRAHLFFVYEAGWSTPPVVISVLSRRGEHGRREDVLWGKQGVVAQGARTPNASREYGGSQRKGLWASLPLGRLCRLWAGCVTVAALQATLGTTKYSRGAGGHSMG